MKAEKLMLKWYEDIKWLPHAEWEMMAITLEHAYQVGVKRGIEEGHRIANEVLCES